MSQETLGTNEIWTIVRLLTRMAYVFERQATDPSVKGDPNIQQTFRKVGALLDEHEEKSNESLSAYFDLFRVNELSEVFKDYRNGKLSEREAKIACWQILTPGDDPAYFDEDLALGFPLPTKEEFRVYGGSKETAIQVWSDLMSGSHGAIYATQRAMRRGESPNFFRGRQLPFTERMSFLAVVFARLLDLKEAEMKTIGKALLELSEGQNENAEAK